MRKTFRLVYISLLVAQALILHVVEGVIPVPLPVPGAKIGLANVISVIGLYTINKRKDVLMIILLRLTLAAMMGGSLSSFIFSFSGAVVSFIIMAAVKELGKDKVSIIGVSCSGAVFHNVGQLLAASFIVHNISVMLYLPLLTFVGIVTGLFIGVTASYAVVCLARIPYFK